MIAVRVDDLAFTRADAIARPVNDRLRAVTQVMRRLEEAAGNALVTQLRVNEPLGVGAAVVTHAGAIEAELMIHAVVVSEEEPVSAPGVRRALNATMQQASAWDVRHLAIAPYGLGPGNLSIDESAELMADVLVRHAAAAPIEVTIVVENDVEAAVYEAAVSRRAGIS